MPDNSNKREIELLAIRCQLGERGAFDELVDRWHTPLWNYIRRIANRDDVAEELVQETWLRVLRGIVKLREPARLVEWIFGIAHRVLMDRLREKYRRAAVFDGAIEASLQELPASSDEDAREDLEQLFKEIDRLPLPQQELLALYYLDELTVDEVGRVLDVPAGTVKSRLFQIRKVLRQTLTAEEAR
jgi:RNA polymerase sigma-70 factor (ECF subfamily)